MGRLVHFLNHTESNIWVRLVHTGSFAGCTQHMLTKDKKIRSFRGGILGKQNRDTFSGVRLFVFDSAGCTVEKRNDTIAIRYAWSKHHQYLHILNCNDSYTDRDLLRMVWLRSHSYSMCLY
jgi:hypothetical protein